MGMPLKICNASELLNVLEAVTFGGV